MRSFEKPAIDVSQQLDLLEARGLHIICKSRAIHFLEAVSFFRLTPYMRPFQVPGDPAHKFLPGTGFQQLSQLYNFDRRLRLLVMDAIERVEVATRAIISNHMCPSYGSHWYLERQHFKKRYEHDRLLERVTRAQNKALEDYNREVKRIEKLKSATRTHQAIIKKKRSQESYARHYALHYDDPSLMPSWAMLEELTLGELSHLYQGLSKDSDRKKIARHLNLPAPLLESWLHTLTVIRNICAHHARLWNRELGIKPQLPRRSTVQWPSYFREERQHTRVGIVVAMLHHLMQRVSPDTYWHKRLADLIDDHPSISKDAMGLPHDWSTDDFWRNS